MPNKNGYTLVEVSISMAILSVVSLLGWIVVDSSTKAAQLTDANAEVQSNLRNCMGELMAEVRQAYTERVTDSSMAPDDVAMIAVGNGGTSLTFQVPEASDTSPLPQASNPVVITWENEDLSLPTDPGYAKLDAGEDADGDGALTRRLVRSQNGATRVVGASNDISDVQFALLPNMNVDDERLTTLQIRLESVKRYGAGRERLVRSELVSSIHLEN